MPVLASDAVLLSPVGPVLASALDNGSEVLGVVSGKRGVVQVTSPEDVGAKESPAVWICTDAGDLVLGSDSQLATSRGLLTGRSLLELRDGTTVGRMSGEWPSVEAYGGESTTPTPTQISAFLEHLSAAAVVEGAGGNTLRVGSLPGTKDAAASLLAGGAYEMEPGPAGWSWIRRKASSASQGSATAELLYRAVFHLWQKGDGKDSYRLPMEITRLRWLSVLILAELGRPYMLDYRPRYWPMEVELVPGDKHRQLAKVQTVLPIHQRALVKFQTAPRGSYVVANTFLCTG